MPCFCKNFLNKSFFFFCFLRKKKAKNEADDAHIVHAKNEHKEKMQFS